MAASDSSLHLFSRDKTQAYPQSKTSLARPIYVKPPDALNIPDDLIIRLERPLYGISEAGAHWYNTYHNHHLTRFYMKAATHDPCFCHFCGISAYSAKPRAVTCLQTDDTLIISNEAFLKLEEFESSTFSCKPRKEISPETPLRFNGATIGALGPCYTLCHDRQLESMTLLNAESFSKADFVSQRALGAYIAAVYRLDLTFMFSSAAQITEPTKKDVSQLNEAIAFVIATKEQVLKFLPLDLHSVFIAVFIDASFATNEDSSSQLGFLITLMDKSECCNIIHYSSSKSRRIARSALAAEFFSLVPGFDRASTLRLAVNDMLNRLVPLKLYTDSKRLYDGIVGLNLTTEKRLLIDLRLLRQSYESREIAEVIWIPGAENPADALTKKNASLALRYLLDHNHLKIHPHSWIERPEKITMALMPRLEKKSSVASQQYPHVSV